MPVGLAAMALTVRFVPESRAPRRPPDAVGQLLVIVLLAGLTYAVIEAPRLGWGSAIIACCRAAALVAGAALIPTSWAGRNR